MVQWLLLGLLAAATVLESDRAPLSVPVDGIAANRLTDTFGAPRSGGRTHAGTDIFARRGTPVRAAHHGIVLRIGTTPLGGRSVWTFGRRGVLCYYTHLDSWAPGLAAGDWVSPATQLGTVGNGGNARTTRPHLHFEVRPLVLLLAATDPLPMLGAHRAHPSRSWMRP